MLHDALKHSPGIEVEPFRFRRQKDGWDFFEACRVLNVNFWG